MQKAMVSMVRFSSAFTLYGLGELETAMSLQEGQGISEAMRDLEAVLNSMSDSMEGHLKQSNRKVVKSAKRIATQFVQQSADGLNMMDPRRVVRAANDLLNKITSEVSKKPGDHHPTEAHRPLLAVEVLTSSAQ